MTPSALSLPVALATILSRIQPVTAHETVAANQALGRIIAQPVLAAMDLPPFANSAMDGYALRHADLAPGQPTPLRCIGTALAGRPFAGSMQAGECVRIMTGAMLPDGADSVVMQEHVTAPPTPAAYPYAVTMPPGIACGEHVRPAGEEIRQGSVLIPIGKRIGPAELGLLAAANQTQATVLRRVHVAYFSTGDEIQQPGQPLQPGQIYDSNRPLLAGMLARAGHVGVDLGIIPDQPQHLRQAMQQAAVQADAILTSGGVSVGDADYVKTVLQEGGSVDFWKILIKPGHPLAFGAYQNTWLFGLPGNPVSAMVTATQLVLPALRHMSGETPLPATLVLTARCQERLGKKPGRREFQRGILTQDGEGNWQVRSTGQQGSGMLSSLSMANCFIVLPEECSGVVPGDKVEVQPFVESW